MRRLCATVAMVLSAALLTSCDTDNQLAPSLPRVLALQVDGGQLRILTGTPCIGVDRVVVTFAGGPEEPVPRAQLRADPAVTVDRLAVGAEVTASGFAVTEALPAGFDWRDYSQVEMGFDGPRGSVGVGSAPLDPVKEKGASRAGDGTAYVRDEGWLTPDQIVEGNETSFLTPCTPDPAGGAA